MSVVEIEIADGTITAQDPARAITWTSADEVLLRGNRIIAIGSEADPGGAVNPNELTVRRPAFAPAGFFPDLASAVLFFAIAKASAGALSFRRPAIMIRWQGWDRLGIDDRRALIQRLPSNRIDVNGRPVVRPVLDVPVLGSQFGDRVRLTADGPWERRPRRG